MSDAFVGEIRMFPSPGIGSEPPQGWLFCRGQIVNINDYQALYSLIGNAYGGAAPMTFALPDMRGRAAIGQGAGPSLTPRTLGQAGGVPTVTLTAVQTPAHTHPVMASTDNATVDKPGSTMVPAGSGTNTTLYTKVDPTDNSFVFDPNAVSYSGGSQPHNNVMPSLGVNFIICFNGLYPERP